MILKNSPFSWPVVKSNPAKCLTMKIRPVVKVKMSCHTQEEEDEPSTFKVLRSTERKRLQVVVRVPSHEPADGKGGEGIVIAPHDVGGHLLGGTDLWKITKDGEDVFYAVDFNRRKEMYSFVRPDIDVSYNALNSTEPPKQQIRQMDKDFVDTILRTLEDGGNVLLPVETADRVMELLLVLEEHCSLKSLNVPIFFLTYVSSSTTIDDAKSFLELKSDAIAKSFETSCGNAFRLNNIGACSKFTRSRRILVKPLKALPSPVDADPDESENPVIKRIVEMEGAILLKSKEKKKHYREKEIRAKHKKYPEFFIARSNLWEEFEKKAKRMAFWFTLFANLCIIQNQGLEFYKHIQVRVGTTESIKATEEIEDKIDVEHK